MTVGCGHRCSWLKRRKYLTYGVLEKFRSCLIEMLLESKRVKIEGLGTFYASMECKGAANEFLKKCSFINVTELAGG